MTRGFRILVLAGACVLLAIAAGGAALVWGAVPMIAEGWRSRGWPSAPATVEHSAAVARRGPVPYSSSGGRSTHAVEVRYRFSVGGRQYEGDRRSLDLVGKMLMERNAVAIAAELPVGATVPAYYDPADPARSLLEPGVPVGSVIGSLIGLGIMAVSLFVLVRYLFPELRGGSAQPRRVPMPY